jgi:hypothetical protein
MTARHTRTVVISIAVAIAAIAAVALLVTSTSGPPDGPVAIAWDRTACEECHMHVGEPRFAAQIHTDDGEVLVFDDPGCLLRWADAHHARPHAVYYRHVREARWIPESRVAFVAISPTPMGYGLGAVDARDAARDPRQPTLTLAEARRRALAGEQHAEDVR